MGRVFGCYYDGMSVTHFTTVGHIAKIGKLLKAGAMVENAKGEGGAFESRCDGRKCILLFIS